MKWMDKYLTHKIESNRITTPPPTTTTTINRNETGNEKKCRYIKMNLQSSKCKMEILQDDRLFFSLPFLHSPLFFTFGKWMAKTKRKEFHLIFLQF